MSEIVKVSFDGDDLEAVRDGDRAWLVVKRVCQVFDFHAHGQIAKLKEAPWAVTQMICATGADGKRYQMFCLDLDSLPGWLFTLNPNKIAAQFRPKLIRWQREGARALRDLFFGRPLSSAMPLFQELERRMLSRSHVRNCDDAKAMVRNAIRGAATARRETFQKCHGALRKRYRIPSYQDLTLIEVPPAMEWLQSHVRDTPVGLLARQLSLWPTL